MNKKRVTTASAGAAALAIFVTYYIQHQPAHRSVQSRLCLKSVSLPTQYRPEAIFGKLPREQRGIDCSEDVRGCDLKCLTKNVSYVGRYYCSTDRRKVLTRSEGLAITRNGMRILVFFQNGARTKRSFGAQQATRNGAYAWSEAHSVGQPSGSAIYFCVDYDAPANDINSAIVPYFDHLTAGMEIARNAWRRKHRAIKLTAASYVIGIYAGPPVIQAILADPKQPLGPHPCIWLSMPPIWRDPEEPAQYNRCWQSRRWAMWQIGPGAICHRKGKAKSGFPCDLNSVGTAFNGSFVLTGDAPHPHRGALSLHSDAP